MPRNPKTAAPLQSVQRIKNRRKWNATLICKHAPIILPWKLVCSKAMKSRSITTHRLWKFHTPLNTSKLIEKASVHDNGCKMLETRIAPQKLPKRASSKVKLFVKHSQNTLRNLVMKFPCVLRGQFYIHQSTGPNSLVYLEAPLQSLRTGLDFTKIGIPARQAQCDQKGRKQKPQETYIFSCQFFTQIHRFINYS
jgi:hypothetical protein